VTTDQHEDLARRHGHERCLLCGRSDRLLPGLRFRPDGDGGVTAELCGDERLQGYAQILHGGVVAAVLDAAMTHCLFHRGVAALTGELRVRYVHPVPCDAGLTVRAAVTSERSPLYRLRAELARDGVVLAWAEARFMRRAESAGAAAVAAAKAE